MKNNNPMDKEQELSNRLEEYEVSIPTFSRKKKLLEKLADYLATPATNPIDMIISTDKGVLFTRILPVAGSGFIALLQALLLT